MKRDQYLIDRNVSISGKSEILGLGINNHQHTITTVILDDLVNLYIIGMQLWSSVVPSNNLLSSVNLCWGVILFVSALPIHSGLLCAAAPSRAAEQYKGY